ncbi:tetratricopeptide repeat protein [Mariniphaga sp.]|uniref:tetratricopeptide repeat protein n=1 Tax=Mariniphaga sp. TaxID=1954475 RepID=UPI00356362CF
MQKRIGLIVVLTLFLLAVQAQQKLNYPEVDKVSYELYMQGKWTELIDYSKEARRQDIDFFYLQARTGIAYYNLKKYRIASEWFLKAWESDQSFEWLQEYLYYSLLWGGRASEASKVAGSFSPEMQDKISFSEKKITRVGLEAGYSFNPDFETLNAAPHGQQAGVGEDYGEAFYLKNYHFESFDLSHRITPGISVNHNLTYVGLNREQQIDWGSANSFPMETNQFQYYLNPQFLLGKKLNISPSISAIWGSYDFFAGGFTGNQMKMFYNASSRFSDFVFSTSVWSHFGGFSPGAEMNLANITDQKFTQLSAWLTVYPFSNLNFYFTPRVYFKSSEENGFGFNTFGISGGAQLGPVHFYGQYLNGEMENFIEAGGYVVSNFPGVSEQKFSGSIYFPTGKKYQFVLRYLSQDVTEKYRVYTNLVESNSVNYNYMKHTLTAGISWNF